MSGRYRTFEELVGKAGAGQEPACTAPFGGVGRPRGRAAPGLPVPGFDRATSVEDVFGWLEAYGLSPFPNVRGWDRQTAIDRLNACLAAPHDLVEAVTPDPRIGINNPALHFESRVFLETENPKDPAYVDAARTTDKYNFPPNVMFDLARIGVGTLRHLQGPDLAWLHLIGDDAPIVPPREMEDLLSANDWGVFGRFAYTVITCLYTGQRIIPLIFGAGGGSSTPVAGVDAARPSFQRGAYIPVDAGWDGWYWDFTGEASTAVTYQRYALNLWREDPPEGSYAQECCYRKCLGLLTFARLVGDFLTLLADAIETGSGGTVALRDIVPAIECGNEMDVFYKLSDPEHRAQAAMEFGRYHALLAGPIMAQGLGLRARLGETFFWVGQRTDWDDTVRWLRETITLGIVAEVARWRLLAVYPAADPLWSRLAVAADWNWWTTPGASCAGDLVHEIGFHSFTWMNSWGPRSNYRPETDFSDEAAELVAEVAQHGKVLAALGHSLEWSCCVGFQGSRPSDPVTSGPVQDQDQFFVENTLAHQGGMVARRMLAACTQPTPPTFVTWYASMSGLTKGKDDWDLYASSGVRNVLYRDDGVLAEPMGPYEVAEKDFTCGKYAWPRPAWYTLRRVSWLLARAKRVERVYQNGVCGAMAVRLVAREGFSTPAAILTEELGTARARTWRYAYVAWLDGSTAAAVGGAAWLIELRVSTRLVDGDWALLPLVPTVECGSDASPPPEDRYKFASAVMVDWNATPQASTVSERRRVGEHIIEIAVRPSNPSADPADPAANPAPICVLCDHEVVGMSLRLSTLLPGVAAPGSGEPGEFPRASAGEDTTRDQNVLEQPR